MVDLGRSWQVYICERALEQGSLCEAVEPSPMVDTIWESACSVRVRVCSRWYGSGFGSISVKKLLSIGGNVSVCGHLLKSRGLITY